MNTDYLQGLNTSFAHALSTGLRRRRTHVAAAMVLLPAFIPLLLQILPHGVEVELAAATVRTQMIEILYIIMAVTPLLALFFGSMLIGEDVEAQTVSYILTRPVPRSAWVAGRFLAYLVLATGMIVLAMLIVSATAAPLGGPPAEQNVIVSLLRYAMVAAFALLGYGALCTLLGAVVRRPVVVGILLIFLWQRFAMLAPGLSDFLTIEKYVIALLPGDGQGIVSRNLGTAIDAYRTEIPVSALSAAVVLIAFAALCLAFTVNAVKQREYTTPVAVTE